MHFPDHETTFLRDSAFAGCIASDIGLGRALDLFRSLHSTGQPPGFIRATESDLNRPLHGGRISRLMNPADPGIPNEIEEGGFGGLIPATVMGLVRFGETAVFSGHETMHIWETEPPTTNTRIRHYSHFA
jgi:hypothetical protein